MEPTKPMPVPQHLQGLARVVRLWAMALMEAPEWSLDPPDLDLQMVCLDEYGEETYAEIALLPEDLTPDEYKLWHVSGDDLLLAVVYVGKCGPDSASPKLWDVLVVGDEHDHVIECGR